MSKPKFDEAKEFGVDFRGLDARSYQLGESVDGERIGITFTSEGGLDYRVALPHYALEEFIERLQRAKAVMAFRRGQARN